MKKLICVMTLVCIGILLVSCGSKRLDNPKAQFIRDFGLNIEKEDCVLEELFNNYEGVPYEGIKARSVPLSCVTRYCSAVSVSRMVSAAGFR